MQRLLYLAENYFHQDWDIESSTPLGVIGIFLEEEPSEIVEELRNDLRGLLESMPDEETLYNIWHRQGRADWDPITSGWQTYRSWLEDVLAALDS